MTSAAGPVAAGRAVGGHAPAAAEPPGAAQRWSVPQVVADWMLAVAGVASLIITFAVVTSRKWMWFDEVATSFLVNDPSWRHMATAIARVETAPPLYHVLLRVWVVLFGGAPLSLRLFTVVGLCAALLILWSALLRAFPWQAVALGVLTVFCGSDLFYLQVAEVRYYGLLATLVSVGVLLCLRVMTDPAAPRHVLVANGLVQALLVLTHIYGGLYSAALLGALVAYDVSRGVVRPSRWIAYPIGWLVLLPWLPVYAAQRATWTKPWIAAPGIRDLLRSYRFEMSSDVVPAVLLAGVLLTAIGGALRPRADSAAGSVGRTPAPSARGAVMFIAAGLLTVPLMSFVVSRLFVSVFYPRYFITAAYGTAILAAYVVATMMEDGPVRAAPSAGRTMHRFARPLLAVGWTGIYGLLLVRPVADARTYFPTAERPGAIFERLRIDGLPATSVPLVVENAFDYLPIMAYTTLPQSAYTFVLDSAVAFAPNSFHREPLGYTTMTLYRGLGYAKGHVEDVQRFLCEHPVFIILDSPETTWYEQRVASDSAFVSTALGRTEGTLYNASATVRLVRRVPGRTPRICTGGDSRPPTSR